MNFQELFNDHLLYVTTVLITKLQKRLNFVGFCKLSQAFAYFSWSEWTCHFGERTKMSLSLCFARAYLTSLTKIQFYQAHVILRFYIFSFNWRLSSLDKLFYSCSKKTTRQTCHFNKSFQDGVNRQFSFFAILCNS